MASYNRVVLMGNLTRDPELKYLPNNTAVCDFGMAMSRRYRDKEGNNKEDVCFVDVSAFARTAEVIKQYFSKGKPILIEGRLNFRQWTAQDGGKRSKLSVVAESFEFVGSREGGAGGEAPAGGGGYRQARPAAATAPGTSPAPSYDAGGYDAPPAYDGPPMDDSFHQEAPPQGDKIPF